MKLKDRTLFERSISGGIWAVSGSTVQGIIQLIIGIILARLLEPRDFGLMGMVTVLVAFGNVMSILGIGNALIQREIFDDLHVKSSISFVLIMGFIITILFWLLAERIASFYESNEIIPLVKSTSVIFIFNGLSSIHIAMLQKKMLFNRIVLIETISIFIGYGIIGISLALYGYGVWSLVCAIVSNSFMRMVLSVALSFKRWITLSFSWKHFVELVKYGIGNTLTQIAVVGSGQIDNIVVGKILGPIALGFYMRAYQVADLLLSRLNAPISNVLFAAYSDIQSKPEGLKGGYLQSLSVISLASATSLFILSSVSSPLITGLFGSQWEGAAVSLQILAAGSYFRACYRNADTLIKAKGGVYWQAKLHAAFISVLLLTTIIGSKWGIEGVSIGVFLYYLFMYLAILTHTGRILNITIAEHFKVQGAGLFSGILAGLTSYISIHLLQYVKLPSILSLFISVISGISVLALFVLTFPKIFLGQGGLRLLEHYRERYPMLNNISDRVNSIV